MEGDALSGLSQAPSWSFWVASLGRGAIGASTALFILAIVLSGLARKREALQKPGNIAFAVASCGFFVAILSLGVLFVRDQFQYRYVFEHSDIDAALKYKVAAVWGAQEGSFLLWACGAAFFGLIALRGTGIYRRWFVIAYSLFLGSLSAILAFETPFDLLRDVTVHGKVFVPPTGQGLNPLLQNYWIVIHPPTIFFGFGSLTVLFAYAVAAMMTKNVDDWAGQVRPWALLSTAVLGLGIGMGGLWAYETLGWGGFWGWDPVENASFVPWLFAVGLAHGTMVQVNRVLWKSSNLMLAGLAFISFVYGTFLTRSGLLDKVSNHSFASMDRSALVILRICLGGLALAFMALWLWRGRGLKSEKTPVLEGDANREGLLRFGILLLSLLSVGLALGMSWPVISGMLGKTVSAVGEGLYHKVVIWFFIPIMLLMAIAPFVSWKGMTKREIATRTRDVVLVTLGSTGLSLILFYTPWGVHPDPKGSVGLPGGLNLPLAPWMAFLLGLCLFVAIANISRGYRLIRKSPGGTGGFWAHVGLAVLLAGLILSRGFERKEEIMVRPGAVAAGDGMGYRIDFKGPTTSDIFRRDRKIRMELTSPNGDTIHAEPALFYTDTGDGGEPKPTVWPHIDRHVSHDTYVAMTPPVIGAFAKPIRLVPGQSFSDSDLKLTYQNSTMEGKPGSMGVKFGARVLLEQTDEKKVKHRYMANPQVQLTQEGLVPTMPKLGPDLRVAIAGGVDAADHGASLMLFFDPPLYPVTVFYKPMTGLVWLGTAIMTIGGLMAAYARRRAVSSKAEEALGSTAPSTKSRIHAPVSIIES